MDDPLRPKTVPLSAETILWFEFLLDPTLLTEHLAKFNASEYLVKFNWNLHLHSRWPMFVILFFCHQVQLPLSSYRNFSPSLPRIKRIPLTSQHRTLSPRSIKMRVWKLAESSWRWKYLDWRWHRTWNGIYNCWRRIWRCKNRFSCWAICARWRLGKLSHYHCR